MDTDKTMHYKWRQPLTLPGMTTASWESILGCYQNGKARPEEYSSDEKFDEDIEIAYAMYRWSRSPKLTCRVTKRMVSTLMSTAFDDLQVKDIYLPDGVDCFQLVVEHDDPIVKDNIIFIRPEETNLEELVAKRLAWFKTQYFALIGTESKIGGIMHVSPSKIIADTIELFDDATAHPVNPRYLSIIAAVGFLADSNEQTFYRHCVLNSDEAKYRSAISREDKQAMRFLEDRAIRRGKNERLFDTFSIDIGESEPQGNVGVGFQGGSKRPHLRRGHFKAIRHGEGRRKVRMQWIPPVIVRRDLLADN
jgi:hypothetical protein